MDAAVELALRHLASCARSSGEIKNYLLRRGGTASVIDAALKKLQRLNYVDDAAFARDWAISRAQNRGWGPQKIARELETKGIDPAVIRAAVQETFEQENEAERARELLAKQFRNEDLQEPRALRRATALLQRRGYSHEVIAALLRCPIDENC